MAVVGVPVHTRLTFQPVGESGRLGKLALFGLCQEAARVLQNDWGARPTRSVLRVEDQGCLGNR
jgi:hypothetical protein